ncbi:MAG: Asp-tRNA(Asn)/Glu-tRNA(Gln) amidotransferase subunit GatA [Rickettsiaceae bacterium]|nr:Asp-tRNA(Asn)/Glu-tRNA(Gln) amidotransferase subunit GatA [Rickettsiaceae bacterium]
MSELIKLTLSQALKALKNKEFSALNLVNDHIEQIEKHKNLNAFITYNFEHAISAAKNVDDRANIHQFKQLQGIPLGIKDLFCTKGLRTTSGSKMLENFVPGYESTVSQKLLDAGAIFLGKTNMDEFAMGSSNTTSYFGNCINPWKRKGQEDVDLVPGGSSGGSAAAVSAFMAMAATASDTGGSVRQPASFTGIVGVKPTYGRCSRYGMVAFSSSLDQAGMVTRDVLDAAITLETIMGFDPKDSTSVDMPTQDLQSATLQNMKGKKIGIIYDLLDKEGLDPEVKKMWLNTIDMCIKEGVECVPIKIPSFEYALAVYYVIAPAEASSNLARYDGVRYGLSSEDAKSLEELYYNTRTEGFGDEVKRRLMVGTFLLSSRFLDAYYIQAQKVRRIIAEEFYNSLKKVDAILLPSAPTEAFGISEITNDPVQMYLNDIFTIPVSLAGLPAISIPVTLSSRNLPLGMQIVGRAFDEKTIFEIAANLERAVNFKFAPGGF